jgi:formylglycine-generating enzyme required for sulfatase activity
MRFLLVLLFLTSCGGSADCPDGMTEVAGASGAFCISTYEAEIVGRAGNRDQGVNFPDGSTTGKVQSKSGVKAGQVSWYQATAACKNHGWHLCTSAEWEDACDGQPGTGGSAYPTPDGLYKPDQCPIGDFQNGVVAPLGKTGERPDCHTASGVHDLLGNLWEWTDPGGKDPQGRPLIDKRGGGHYGAEPVACKNAAVGTHGPGFVGSIGFRCCTSL